MFYLSSKIRVPQNKIKGNIFNHNFIVDFCVYTQEIQSMNDDEVSTINIKMTKMCPRSVSKTNIK